MGGKKGTQNPRNYPDGPPCHAAQTKQPQAPVAAIRDWGSCVERRASARTSDRATAMASRSASRAFEGEGPVAEAWAGPRVRGRSRAGEEMAQRGSAASMRLSGGAAPRVGHAVPPPRGDPKRRRSEWNVAGERGWGIAGSGVQKLKRPAVGRGE